MARKINKGQEEKRPTIVLKTVRNGYLLELGNEGFMYFNVRSLLEGFCIHVGLERLQAMTREEIQKLLEATVEGSLVRQLQDEVTSLQAQLAEYEEMIVSQKRLIRKLKQELR